MTPEEAKTVSKIIQQADGGCSHCIGQLEDLMNHYFPDFVWGFGDCAEDYLVERTEVVSPNVEPAQSNQEEKGE